MRHRDKSIITPRTMASVHAWRRRVFNLPKVAPPEPEGWQGNKVGFALLTCETLEFVVFMSDSSALARRYSLAEGFRLLIGPGFFASRHWTVDRLGDEGIQVQVRDSSRPGAPNDWVCPAEDDQPDRGRRAVFPALLSRTIIVVKTDGRSSLSVNTRTNSHQARINPEPIPSHNDTTPRNGNGNVLSVTSDAALSLKFPQSRPRRKTNPAQILFSFPRPEPPFFQHCLSMRAPGPGPYLAYAP